MLLSAEHLTIDFGSRRLLDDVNFYLNEGDKTGIIGINGTGKSTFLKVLAGGLEPDAGTVARNPNVQVSVLPQNPVMEDGATVLEQVFLHFPSEFRALNEYEAKSMLNRLGLPDYDQKVGSLSGGQRKRAALAAALIHPADVLVLDEPTNDLDVTTLSILEDYLQSFPGPVLAVSHDRFFLDKLAESIFEVRNGEVLRFTGNWSDWAAKRREEAPEAAEKPRPAAERPRERKLKFTYREQREFDTIDGEIEDLEARLTECRTDQERCGSDYVKLQELQARQTELEAALEEKTERWVYLNELKEKIDAQRG